MMHTTQVIRLGGLAAGVVLIGVLCTALPRQNAASTGTYITEYRQTVERWRKIFADNTTADAYAQFRREGDSQPFDKSHILAHIIGGILFDKEGVDGIAYCTADYYYGCYHGFSSRAVEVHGEASIQMVLDACDTEALIDCKHGTGHGMLAYYGDAHVNDALARCEADPYPIIAGCRHGVLMEYFLNSMRKADGRKLVPYDPANPDSPCTNDIDSAYQPECYYKLPLLWRVWSVYRGEDQTMQFKAMGDNCAKVSSAALQTLCFKGAGEQVHYLIGDDPDLIREKCMQMPRNGRAACMEMGLSRRKQSDTSSDIPNDVLKSTI
jgi:hypothetical protein